MTDDELEATWTRYFEEHARADRDELILQYTPLVRSVAARVARSLSYSIEQDDLFAYGVFGLVTALERFDAGFDVKFETFAGPRIRGAMIDEIRSADWVPRSVRDKLRAVSAAETALNNELGRSPSDREVAARLGVSMDEYLRSFQPLLITSLDMHDDTYRETFEDPDAAPVVEFDVTAIRHRLVAAINQLSPREREVLALYYYEGLTLSEIGAVYGVTESRVSQMHIRAVVSLQAGMTAA